MATEGEAKTEVISGGQGGGLFEDPGHARGDAILIRKWAGTVDQKRVKQLLEKGYELADDAAVQGEKREYTQLMKMFQGYAKLEQDEAKTEQPAGSTTNVQINGNVSLNDGRTELLDIIAAASERAREAESKGTLDAPADAQRAVPPEADD